VEVMVLVVVAVVVEDGQMVGSSVGALIVGVIGGFDRKLINAPENSNIARMNTASSK
jgi:hypothetical protein